MFSPFVFRFRHLRSLQSLANGTKTASFSSLPALFCTRHTLCVEQCVGNAMQKNAKNTHTQSRSSNQQDLLYSMKYANTHRERVHCSALHASLICRPSTKIQHVGVVCSKLSSSDKNKMRRLSVQQIDLVLFVIILQL